MKRYIVYILFCLTVWLTGCEKEVTNIKLPQGASKLVVTSFISPQDTLIRVNVLKSEPVIGKNRVSFYNILNATVIISDGNTTIPVSFNTHEVLYTADTKDFPIIPGKTYFLTVSSREGLKAEAFCTVPLTQNNTVEIEFDSADASYGSGKEYFMRMKWQDTPGETNFYRIAGSTQTEIIYDTVVTVRSNSIYWLDGASELFSDNRLDGSRFTSPKGMIYDLTYLQQSSSVKSATLYAYLLNTDENYFRYHQSLRNNNNDNPFAEPTLIYSNVTGGLGVFAAYNQSALELKLK